jgi:DNA-binding response OmpR family regulator
VARVLVVDDVRFILQMIASIFRDQGHEVLTAENGPDAIDMARTERPDLILLDIAMPGMDGVEVARELRSDGAMSSTRILMVTSQSDSKSIARATEAGADDYVCKPFDTPTLLAKAAKLLGSYRMNLSLDEVGGVPVVTVLTSTLDDGVGTDVDAALEEARSGAAPVILDVGRVTKIDPPAVDIVLRHARDQHEAGRVFHLVQPGKGIGTRTLAVRVEPYARLHDDRTSALKAAGAKLERRKPRPAETARPAAPEAPAKETTDPEAAGKGTTTPEAAAKETAPPGASRNGTAASQPRTPAPSDVLVDAIGNVAMVRVRNHVLSDALPAIRQEVLPRSQRNVLLTLKDVGEIGEGDVGELDALARELQRTGRSLKLVDPTPEVASALRDGGLGRLVVDSAGNRKSEATRASS